MPVAALTLYHLEDLVQIQKLINDCDGTVRIQQAKKFCQDTGLGHVRDSDIESIFVDCKTGQLSCVEFLLSLCKNCNVDLNTLVNISKLRRLFDMVSSDGAHVDKKGLKTLLTHLVDNNAKLVDVERVAGQLLLAHQNVDQEKIKWESLLTTNIMETLCKNHNNQYNQGLRRTESLDHIFSRDNINNMKFREFVICQKEREIMEQSHSLQIRMASIKNLESEIQAKMQHLNQRQTDMQSVYAHITEFENELNCKKTLLNEWESQLKEKSQDMSNREKHVNNVLKENIIRSFESPRAGGTGDSRAKQTSNTYHGTGFLSARSRKKTVMEMLKLTSKAEDVYSDSDSDSNPPTPKPGGSSLNYKRPPLATPRQQTPTSSSSTTDNNSTTTLPHSTSNSSLSRFSPKKGVPPLKIETIQPVQESVQTPVQTPTATVTKETPRVEKKKTFLAALNFFKKAETPRKEQALNEKTPRKK